MPIAKPNNSNQIEAPLLKAPAPSKLLRDLVDLVGIEPTTSSMPWKRAPSCATGPLRQTLPSDGVNRIHSRPHLCDSQRAQVHVFPSCSSAALVVKCIFSWSPRIL